MTKWLALALLGTVTACGMPAAGPPAAPMRPSIPSAPAAAPSVAPSASAATPANDPLRDAAQRLTYVDQAGKVWLVAFDEATRIVGKREIATLGDPHAAGRLTWSGDGRYLGWREIDREGGKHRLVVYDLRADETWSVHPWRSYLFMGPANHGFVFYDGGPAYFEPRTDAGAHSEQAPEPRALRPPLPAHDMSCCDPNPMASWHDRVFVAVSGGLTSMYGGPQKLFLVGFSGETVRVADDEPGGDAINNLPMNSLVPDSSGDFVAYFTGATAGREGEDFDSDYWILKILDTHTWRTVATHDAGCWERKDLSHGRCRATPSWLAPAGRGAFAFIKSQGGQAAPLLRASAGGLKPIGVDATLAMGNARGTLLWLQPGPSGASGSVLSVKSDGAAQTIAEQVVTALWAPALLPDDSAARREVGSRLDPSDQGYGDPQRGLGWGNRCYAHIRAGRLEAARAACEMGLLLMPNASNAGALEYNLALVEERSGHRPEACARLGRSLAVRPHNEITASTAKRWKCGG
jgi:hypothetical protein